MKETYVFYGSIEGYLVSVEEKIAIHSLVDKKVISCYFPDELLEQAKHIIDKKVYLFGVIRKYLHGDIIDIQVEELKLLPQPSPATTLESILRQLRGESLSQQRPLLNCQINKF